MSSKRLFFPWEGSKTKPAIYHCVSRVVDRRFVFGDEERETFRMFMRMYERFSGCRARAEENEEWAAEIHARFTYRMNDLSEFMKGDKGEPVLYSALDFKFHHKSVGNN